MTTKTVATVEYTVICNLCDKKDVTEVTGITNISKTAKLIRNKMRFDGWSIDVHGSARCPKCAPKFKFEGYG